MEPLQQRLEIVKSLFLPSKRTTVTLADLDLMISLSDEENRIPFARIERVTVNGEDRIKFICLLPIRSRDTLSQETQAALSTFILSIYKSQGDRKVIHQTRLSLLTDVPVVKQLKRMPRFWATVVTALISGNY